MKTSNEMITESETINETIIDKKTLNHVYLRSLQMEFSWNYERQMNMAFCYAMIPALKKIYKDDLEGLKKALKRHLEFFNTTPHIVTSILGISIAMEEENKKQPEFDDNSIRNIKTALMGPLAGIGDSFFWGTLRVIATGIGISLASKGNLLGPILFLLIFNIPHFIIRYYLLKFGYQFGVHSLKNLEQEGTLQKLTRQAAILGVIVIGAMSAQMIDINLQLTLFQDNPLVLQDVLNDIAPKLLPLGAFFAVYHLLKKRINPLIILALIAVFSIAMSYLGVL